MVMTDAENDIAAEYIRTVADALRLGEWSFTLRTEPPDNEDAYASVEPLYGRRHASVYLCADFRTLKPETQRNTIVHEMMHCHHFPMTEIMRCSLPKQLSQSAYDVLWESFRQQTEYMVDLLAGAFERHVPLIAWERNDVETDERLTFLC